MANATVKPLPVAPSPPRTVLLSEDESITLLALCANVGGAPNGRRGHVDSIGSALSDVLDISVLAASGQCGPRGSITFPDSRYANA